jgi:hypothetical protein
MSDYMDEDDYEFARNLIGDYGSDYDNDFDGYDGYSEDSFVSGIDDFDLPSHLRDYHPLFKKSEATFLDVYIVAKKTKELLNASREYIIARQCEHFDVRVENIFKDLETIQTVAQKRSTSVLANVLSLPDLVIEKIFDYIEESYNFHFDYNGPENDTWLFENQDGILAADCYYPISGFYEFILSLVYPVMMSDLGFEETKDICSSWPPCGNDEVEFVELADEFVSRSSQFKRLVTQLCSRTQEIEIECDPAADGSDKTASSTLEFRDQITEERHDTPTEDKRKASNSNESFKRLKNNV